MSRWLPLESNPDVLNAYISRLGVSATWTFSDVLGLDPELLAMVPQPCLAVLLLYPLTDNVEKKSIGEERADKRESLYFIKQTIGNACGTIGLIHALLNNTRHLELSDQGTLAKFLAATGGMTPEERATALDQDQAFKVAHEGSAMEGQTETPDLDTKVREHFIAFVHHEQGLYELDGRREGPVYHGASSPETLLQDTAKVVKEFIARDPEETKFVLVALASND